MAMPLFKPPKVPAPQELLRKALEEIALDGSNGCQAERLWALLDISHDPTLRDSLTFLIKQHPEINYSQKKDHATKSSRVHGKASRGVPQTSQHDNLERKLRSRALGITADRSMVEEDVYFNIIEAIGYSRAEGITSTALTATLQKQGKATLHLHYKVDKMCDSGLVVKEAVISLGKSQGNRGMKENRLILARYAPKTKFGVSNNSPGIRGTENMSAESVSSTDLAMKTVKDVTAFLKKYNEQHGVRVMVIADISRIMGLGRRNSASLLRYLSLHQKRGNHTLPLRVSLRDCEMYTSKATRQLWCVELANADAIEEDDSNGTLNKTTTGMPTKSADSHLTKVLGESRNGASASSVTLDDEGGLSDGDEAETLIFDDAEENSEEIDFGTNGQNVNQEEAELEIPVCTNQGVNLKMTLHRQMSVPIPETLNATTFIYRLVLAAGVRGITVPEIRDRVQLHIRRVQQVVTSLLSYYHIFLRSDTEGRQKSYRVFANQEFANSFTTELKRGQLADYLSGALPALSSASLASGLVQTLEETSLPIAARHRPRNQEMESIDRATIVSTTEKGHGSGKFSADEEEPTVLEESDSSHQPEGTAKRSSGRPTTLAFKTLLSPNGRSGKFKNKKNVLLVDPRKQSRQEYILGRVSREEIVSLGSMLIGLRAHEKDSKFEPDRKSIRRIADGLANQGKIFVISIKKALKVSDQEPEIILFVLPHVASDRQRLQEFANSERLQGVMASTAVLRSNTAVANQDGLKDETNWPDRNAGSQLQDTTAGKRESISKTVYSGNSTVKESSESVPLSAIASQLYSEAKDLVKRIDKLSEAVPLSEAQPYRFGDREGVPLGSEARVRSQQFGLIITRMERIQQLHKELWTFGSARISSTEASTSHTRSFSLLQFVKSLSVERYLQLYGLHSKFPMRYESHLRAALRANSTMGQLADSSRVALIPECYGTLADSGYEEDKEQESASLPCVALFQLLTKPLYSRSNVMLSVLRMLQLVETILPPELNKPQPAVDDQARLLSLEQRSKSLAPLLESFYKVATKVHIKTDVDEEPGRRNEDSLSSGIECVQSVEFVQPFLEKVRPPHPIILHTLDGVLEEHSEIPLTFEFTSIQEVNKYWSWLRFLCLHSQEDDPFLVSSPRGLILSSNIKDHHSTLPPRVDHIPVPRYTSNFLYKRSQWKKRSTRLTTNILKPINMPGHLSSEESDSSNESSTFHSAAGSARGKLKRAKKERKRNTTKIAPDRFPSEDDESTARAANLLHRNKRRRKRNPTDAGSETDETQNPENNSGRRKRRRKRGTLGIGRVAPSAWTVEDDCALLGMLKQAMQERANALPSALEFTEEDKLELQQLRDQGQGTDVERKQTNQDFDFPGAISVSSWTQLSWDKISNALKRGRDECRGRAQVLLTTPVCLKMNRCYYIDLRESERQDLPICYQLERWQPWQAAVLCRLRQILLTPKTATDSTICRKALSPFTSAQVKCAFRYLWMRGAVCWAKDSRGQTITKSPTLRSPRMFEPSTFLRRSFFLTGKPTWTFSETIFEEMQDYARSHAHLQDVCQVPYSDLQAAHISRSGITNRFVHTSRSKKGEVSTKLTADKNSGPSQLFNGPPKRKRNSASSSAKTSVSCNFPSLASAGAIASLLELAARSSIILTPLCESNNLVNIDPEEFPSQSRPNEVSQNDDELFQDSDDLAGGLLGQTVGVSAHLTSLLSRADGAHSLKQRRTKVKWGPSQNSLVIGETNEGFEGSNRSLLPHWNIQISFSSQTNPMVAIEQRRLNTEYSSLSRIRNSAYEQCVKAMNALVMQRDFWGVSEVELFDKGRNVCMSILQVHKPPETGTLSTKQDYSRGLGDCKDILRLISTIIEDSLKGIADDVNAVQVVPGAHCLQFVSKLALTSAVHKFSHCTPWTTIPHQLVPLVSNSSVKAVKQQAPVERKDDERIDLPSPTSFMCKSFSGDASQIVGGSATEAMTYPSSPSVQNRHAKTLRHQVVYMTEAGHCVTTPWNNLDGSVNVIVLAGLRRTAVEHVVKNPGISLDLLAVSSLCMLTRGELSYLTYCLEKEGLLRRQRNFRTLLETQLGKPFQGCFECAEDLLFPTKDALLKLSLLETDTSKNDLESPAGRSTTIASCGEGVRKETPKSCSSVPTNFRDSPSTRGDTNVAQRSPAIAFV